MRKCIVTILAFLYISTSTGAMLHSHYCMGKLADWGFGQNDSKYCSNCGMEETGQKEKGCCKDETRFLKNTADQKITESAIQFIQLITVAPPPAIIELPLIGFPFLTAINPINNAPPRNSGIAVYIRNCIFRI